MRLRLCMEYVSNRVAQELHLGLAGPVQLAIQRLRCTPQVRAIHWGTMVNIKETPHLDILCMPSTLSHFHGMTMPKPDLMTIH